MIHIVDNINHKVIMLLLSTILCAMQMPNNSTHSTSRSSALRRVLPHVIILPSIALLLSAVMTWANVGFGDTFFPQWTRSFLTSLVVLPLILTCLGTLESVVNRTYGSMHWVGRKTMVALLTAFAMESVLASVVTLLNNPWGGVLLPYWWAAFSRSLPVGVAIGLFMSFYMKPKLDQLSKSSANAQINQTN